MEKTKLSTYVFIAVILVLLYLSFKILQPYLAFVVISVVLAYSFYPLYKKLLRILKFKSLTAILIIIFIIILIVLPLAFSILTIVESSDTLKVNVSVAALETLTNNANQAFSINLDFNELATQLFQRINQFIISNAPKLATEVADLFIGFMIMFVGMFYLFKQGPQITKTIMEYLPLRHEYREGILKELKSVTYAVIYSEILVAIVQGTLVGISFYIFGLDNPILWGFVAMLLSFLPIVGAFFVWIPAAIFLLLQGNIGLAIGVVLFNIILTSNIDNLMRPRLLSHRSRLHPFLTLLGIFGGIQVMGFVGLILGPMIISLFLVFLGYFNREFFN